MTSNYQKIPSGTHVWIGLLGVWEECEEDAISILTNAGLREIGEEMYDGPGIFVVSSTTPIPETVASMKHVIIEEEPEPPMVVDGYPVQYSELKKQIFKRQQQREKEQLFSMVDEMIVWLKKRRGRLTNANVKHFIAEKGLHNVSASDRKEFDQKVWEKLSVKRRNDG